jgi:hypothetical protein
MKIEIKHAKKTLYLQDEIIIGLEVFFHTSQVAFFSSLYIL